MKSTYPDVKGTYYCWLCLKKHWIHSSIGQAHDPRRLADEVEVIRHPSGRAAAAEISRFFDAR